MTDKKRVFCKDCKWFETNTKGVASTMPRCYHKNALKKMYDPIDGETSYYTLCKLKNENCDCPDFEAKEENKI